MPRTSRGLRQILGDAAVWGLLWLGFWAAAMAAIAFLNPDSIDRGEPLGLVTVFGSMGALTGLVFAWVLGAGARPSFGRAVGLGILATALVQMLYLGHGDQGLLANLGMALAFSLIGGVVSMTWFVTMNRLLIRAI